MITDEGQLRAAYTIADAAEKMRQAADQMQQAAQRVALLLEPGYSGNLERLLELLERTQTNAKH